MLCYHGDVDYQGSGDPVTPTRQEMYREGITVTLQYCVCIAVTVLVTINVHIT